MRIGRILEVFDIFAGYVGYLHCVKKRSEVILVTASVDNFNLYE